MQYLVLSEGKFAICSAPSWLLTVNSRYLAIYLIEVLIKIAIL